MEHRFFGKGVRAIPVASNSYGYYLAAAGGPLELREMPVPEPGPDEVIVAVAGCGICHTDVAFARQGVPTRHALPLVLGHEISGRVVAAGERAASWLGRAVIIPAVTPCGECAACRAGQPTICRAQFMPGNDGHGGFATHVRVPGRGLCEVPEVLPAGVTLEQLSVIADAVTTPLEAIRRSGLGADDVAVIVGAGGIGGFAVQIAAARGAAVAALDIEPARLELAAAHGASLALNVAGMEEKAVRNEIRRFVKASGRREFGLKIFEMSGAPAGQALAFALLDYGGWLAVVGYTPQKLEVRLSNLMAFDATARGNWGCPPEQYPHALAMVLDGRVRLQPFVERHALEDAPAVFEAAARHELRRRAILVPGGNSRTQEKG